MRKAAAWSAAYALVLQVVLTSTLLASLPRDGSLPVICFNSGIAADGQGGAPGSTDFGIHCPACLARVDLASPPLPLAVPADTRVAVELRHRTVLRTAFRTLDFPLPFRSRAPPASV